MEIILLIIIVGILCILMFVALNKLITSINNDSKEYYFKKVQELDEQLLEKANQLGTKENKEEKGKNKELVVEKPSIDQNLLGIINSTDYENENVLKTANKVDEIFNIDDEKIVKEFISNVSLDKNYQTYQNLLDRFSVNLIYKLKLLDSKSQVKIIKDLISDDEFIIFNDYVTHRKFKLDKFLIDLELLIERSTPKIEVIVGNKNKNYDALCPYIKTTYSTDIYKGLIIKYQDKIYDYSINERDV